jgi:nifR3 family TIM-barrel protein
MEGITDAAFRLVVSEYGKPDVMFTEFTSVDGLLSKGRDKVMENLIFDNTERPIVAQLFGTDPEKFSKATKIVEKLGLDGIDINMGCPDKNVVQNGAGSALIKTPQLAKEIIITTQKNTKLPVSVKTRIGYNEIQTEEWLTHVLETNPAAIIMHDRTKKEMYRGKANWDEIKKAVTIRDELSATTLIIGNGDVQNLSEATARVDQTGVDGIMIGRASMGNPWLFNKNIEKAELSQKQILETMLKHCQIFEKVFQNKRNFVNMRKHMAAYIKGFPNSRKLKMQLMRTENSEAVENIIKNFSTL